MKKMDLLFAACVIAFVVIAAMDVFGDSRDDDHNDKPAKP